MLTHLRTDLTKKLLTCTAHTHITVLSTLPPHTQTQDTSTVEGEPALSHCEGSADL